jgi:hypothetical protein
LEEAELGAGWGHEVHGSVPATGRVDDGSIGGGCEGAAVRLAVVAGERQLSEVEKKTSAKL